MAAKLGVTIDGVVKTIFDKTLTTDLKKHMCTRVKAAVSKSTKLEVVDGEPDKGFSMTVTLELTKDDKANPVQINGSIAMAIMGSGLTASTINLKTPAHADAGTPKMYAASSKDVIDAILDNMLPKVVKAMEAKAP